MTSLSTRELVNRHPHIFALGADGILEMYCDHHMLSTLRTCEAKFYEEQLAHVGTKTSRYFSLEFGIWLHEALDKYYTGWKKFGQPPVLDEWVDWALKLWNEMRMDDFAPAPATLTKEMRGDTKKYYDFCKWDTKGAITRLLIQYYAFYMNQRMRVVDTEISFGRAGEVPLGGINDFCDEPPIRCFLTGRIDLLVDNGTKIGPVDHKSTARFDGYESNDFDPHEGITGYIFAVNSILASQYDHGIINYGQIPQTCNSGWIHHISLADSEPRFKPTLITKTNQQLEEYRMRQLRACKRVYELASSSAKLENYGAVEFATDKCNNIYNSPCPFRELHRQPFIQREGTIAQFYEIKPAWNPAVKKEEKK